jgi:hypothetical protein
MSIKKRKTTKEAIPDCWETMCTVSDALKSLNLGDLLETETLGMWSTMFGTRKNVEALVKVLELLNGHGQAVVLLFRWHAWKGDIPGVIAMLDAAPELVELLQPLYEVLVDARDSPPARPSSLCDGVECLKASLDASRSWAARRAAIAVLDSMGD